MKAFCSFSCVETGIDVLTDASLAKASLCVLLFSWSSNHFKALLQWLNPSVMNVDLCEDLLADEATDV